MMTRFRSAASKLAASTDVSPGSAAVRTSMDTPSLPRVAASAQNRESRHSGHGAPPSRAAGGQRQAVVGSATHRDPLPAACSGSSSRRRCERDWVASTWRPLETTASRLLKSCAIPPLNCRHFAMGVPVLPIARPIEMPVRLQELAAAVVGAAARQA